MHRNKWPDGRGGNPTAGSGRIPHGPYLSAKEEITLAEAKALGKWLTRKAREYERPSRKAKMTALRGKLAYVFRGR